MKPINAAYEVDIKTPGDNLFVLRLLSDDGPVLDISSVALADLQVGDVVHVTIVAGHVEDGEPKKPLESNK